MSSNGWKKYKLGELGKLARGKSKHRPRDAAFLYGGPYPFIQTGDIKSANHKIYKYSQTYSEAGLAQSKLWSQGTIAITIAANIADTSILTFPACFPDSVLGFVADKEKCDIDFMEYLLQYHKKQIQSHAVGSVQDNINLGTFENVEFDIPPLVTQHRIADILSVIDEKIELNRQTNATLEAIAQSIFREWFVEFNYLNATGEMIESELGMVPNGWKIRTLEEIVTNYDNKRVPLSSREREKRKGIYPYYGAASIVDYIDDFLFDGVYLLMGEDGTVITEDEKPVLQYVSGKFWVNNHTHVLQGKGNFSTEFVYLVLKNTNIKHIVTGAVQPKINQGNMNSLPVIIPDKETLNAFQEVIKPTFAYILENEQQSATLASLRDALLPKLMNGEIEV